MPCVTECRRRGGWAWAIDRLVMMLTGAESIRDVILFPLMKPQEKNEILFSRRERRERREGIQFRMFSSPCISSAPLAPLREIIFDVNVRHPNHPLVHRRARSDRHGFRPRAHPHRSADHLQAHDPLSDEAADRLGFAHRRHALHGHGADRHQRHGRLAAHVPRDQSRAHRRSDHLSHVRWTVSAITRR